MKSIRLPHDFKGDTGSHDTLDNKAADGNIKKRTSPEIADMDLDGTQPRKKAKHTNREIDSPNHLNKLATLIQAVNKEYKATKTFSKPAIIKIAEEDYVSSND